MTNRDLRNFHQLYIYGGLLTPKYNLGNKMKNERTIFNFPIIKIAFLLMALLFVSSCQTASSTRMRSDIQPISGSLKISNWQYVKTNGISISKADYSSIDSEAQLTTTVKSTAIYRKIDNNTYSAEGAIIDMDVSSYNFSEPIDTSKYELVKGLEFYAKIDTLKSTIDFDFTSKSKILEKELQKISNSFKLYLKKMIMDVYNIENKMIKQGDKILSIKSNFGNLNVDLDASIIAIGTKYYDNRKVIVGEIDGYMSGAGKNIKIDGLGYMDLKTGLWLYTEMNTSEVEIKDGIFQKISVIIKLKVESELEQKTVFKNPKSTAEQASGNTDISAQSLQRGESKCLELGFKQGTEKFGDCVLKILPIANELKGIKKSAPER